MPDRPPRLASTRGGSNGKIVKYYVYVLSSLVSAKSYVGITNNIERRLMEHNSGFNYFTKQYRPWEVIYTEEYSTLFEARKREKYLKSASGRSLVLKKIFNN